MSMTYEASSMTYEAKNSSKAAGSILHTTYYILPKPEVSHG